MIHKYHPNYCVFIMLSAIVDFNPGEMEFLENKLRKKEPKKVLCFRETLTYSLWTCYRAHRVGENYIHQNKAFYNVVTGQIKPWYFFLHFISRMHCKFHCKQFPSECETLQKLHIHLLSLQGPTPWLAIHPTPSSLALGRQIKYKQTNAKFGQASLYFDQEKLITLILFLELGVSSRNGNWN